MRRRPGMYVGGTDSNALHHLFAEVIDNSMDEAVAGHATFIEVSLEDSGYLSVVDNGRGMPVDPHPKFPKKSALEVIMTMLHAGRQIRQRRLRDLRRTSWRRRLGGERAVRKTRGRGRPRADALSADVRARQADEQAHDRRQDVEPARHQGALSPRSADLRRFRRASIRRACSRWRAPRPICSAASRSDGAAPLRSSATAAKVPAEATFHFPGGLARLSRRRHRGRGTRRRPGLHRPGRKSGQAWLGRMGDRLARRR